MRLTPRTAATTLNPYAPPAETDADIARLPPLPEERFGEVTWSVVHVERRMLQRRLTCSGSVDTEILYDAWGCGLIGECVYVNRRLRTRELGLGFGFEYVAWVSPRIKFHLEWRGHRIPARIEAKMGLTPFRWLQFKHFRLFVAERLIYSEG